MLKYILAIETSCDETSVCIIDLHGNIVVEETFSQISMHVRYGGVVPEIASRSHVLQIQIIVKNCLIAAKIDVQDIVAVAATIAPGLIGGLLVGTMFAKGMAQVLNIPFIGVNHLEGHIFSTKIADKECSFPLLILLVSGGHCQIIFAEKLYQWKQLLRQIKAK